MNIANLACPPASPNPRRYPRRAVTAALCAMLVPCLLSSDYAQPGHASRGADDASPRTAESPAKDDSVAALPSRIVIRESGLYPEDVEWDGERRRFLVSSVGHGSVTAVQDDGTHHSFTDGEGITSALGIHVDNARNRLLVAAADFAAVLAPRVKGTAKLAVYDLTTGKRERLVDLAGLRPQARHLANDVTVDPEGNAYVTDSLSPLIYRVTPAGQASVFLDDPRLDGAGVNLNGIAYHPGGYLMVAMGSHKALYRVPIAAPRSWTKVRLSEPIMADSLNFRPDGNLISALPFAPGVIELASVDGWVSARVIGRVSTTRKGNNTSAALRSGVVYALNSHLDAFGQEPPVQTFEIVRVNLR